MFQASLFGFDRLREVADDIFDTNGDFGGLFESLDQTPHPPLPVPIHYSCCRCTATRVCRVSRLGFRNTPKQVT